MAAGAAVLSYVGGQQAADTQASAQKDAANIGAQSSQNQIKEAQRQFDLSRGDQLPFLNRGNAAGDRLQYLMGLGGGSGSGAPALAAPDRNSIASGLRPGFTSQTSTSSGLYRNPYSGDVTSIGPGNSAFDGSGRNIFDNTQWSPVNQVSDVVDTSGLNSATDAEYQRQLQAYQAAQSQQASQQASQSNDPNFGRLTRDFSLQDILNDPVYNFSKDFGLSEGQKAIERRAQASGDWDSGSTLKALDRFNQGYASQGAGDAFNRFTTQNTNLYNKMAGIAGTGQVAANQLGALGANNTANVLGAMSGGANAQMAGVVGAGNARAAGIGAQGTTLSNLFNNQGFQQGVGNMFGGGSAATNWDGYSNTGMRYSDANALGGMGNTTGYQNTYSGVS